jgi:hypothetical protein
MSGTRITLEVRLGAAYAAAIAAIRERIIESRPLVVEQGHGAMTISLARGPDRRPVIQRVTGAVAQTADLAHRTGKKPARSQTPGRSRPELAAPREEERVLLARARQEFAFAEMLSHLPPGLSTRGTVQRRDDGSLAARIGVAGAGEVGVALSADGTAALDMAEANIAEFSTPDGAVAGCDAERALAAALAEEWRSAGMDVSVDPDSESARAAESPRGEERAR